LELTKPSELLALINAKFMNKMLEISYTQWEDDDLDADESITNFSGTLVDIKIEDNRFQGVDMSLQFESEDHQESIEIIMDFPPDDEDIVAQLVLDTSLHIFGNESTLVLKKSFNRSNPK